DQIRVRVARPREPFLTARGGLHRVPLEGERPTQRRRNRLIVVDNQDAFSHRPQYTTRETGDRGRRTGEGGWGRHRRGHRGVAEDRRRKVRFTPPSVISPRSLRVLSGTVLPSPVLRLPSPALWRVICATLKVWKINRSGGRSRHGNFAVIRR